MMSITANMAKEIMTSVNERERIGEWTTMTSDPDMLAYRPAPSLIYDSGDGRYACILTDTCGLTAVILHLTSARIENGILYLRNGRGQEVHAVIRGDSNE